MAYVTSSEFVHIPATSDGCNAPATTVPCLCDCGCGNFAADDFCTSCYDVCLGEPCDCGLRADNGFFKVHGRGEKGCEYDKDGSPRWDERPDGDGGFGAPHCACGELVVNCDGKCETESAPDISTETDYDPFGCGPDCFLCM